MSHTILIIEDNEQNLYLATFMLEQGGFTVVAARSGLEGIEQEGRIVHDLIMLDIQLTQSDG